VASVIWIYIAYCRCKRVRGWWRRWNMFASGVCSPCCHN